jgi:hypothetical protein
MGFPMHSKKFKNEYDLFEKYMVVQDILVTLLELPERALTDSTYCGDFLLRRTHDLSFLTRTCHTLKFCSISMLMKNPLRKIFSNHITLKKGL